MITGPIWFIRRRLQLSDCEYVSLGAARSTFEGVTAEGAVEKRGEEMLSLPQRLALHRMHTLHAFYQSRESLLDW